MTNKTTSAIDLVERLPSKALFYRGEVPTPLNDEERGWLVEQLHSYPKRVNEDRTCCISALTDMAMTEFCRLMAERAEAADTITHLKAALTEIASSGSWTTTVGNVVCYEHQTRAIAREALKSLGGE